LAKQLPYIKFVLPTAPSRRVTLNGGMSMPAWYDIIGLDERSNESCEGIDQSVQTLHDILTTEHTEHGLSYSRMCLAGFSQGGALSLYTGLQFSPAPLAGVIVMSGYLPHASGFTVTQPTVPVWHGHGTQDMVVSYPVAERSREEVLKKGAQSYTLKTYPMAHTVSPVEINDVMEFLQKILPPDDTCRIVLKDPTAMSVKELKAAIQAAGLTHKMIGFVEKNEFVTLLQNYRNGDYGK
jgi:lysophospholipase II